MSKKGLTFTMDAVFALLIIMVFVPSLLILSFQKSEEETFSLLQMEAEDSMNIVSNLRISDVRNEQVVEDLFASGILADNDLNSTLLEVIGSLWASDNATLLMAANNISEKIINKIVPETVKWRMVIENETVYNSSQNITRTLTLSKRIVSGVAKGKPSGGFLSNAFITGIKKQFSSYVFFGGFVGQGNITAVIRDIPPNSTVQSVYLELNPAGNFSFYANSVFCQNMSIPGANFTVYNWTLTDSCLSLVKGRAENNFTINFTGDLTTSFVGGGFLKLTYTSEEFVPVLTNRHYFPGIDGLVNIYDSFYVNGNISSMNVTLRYRSGLNYSVMMQIANATVLNKTSNGSIENVFINSSDLSKNLTAKGISYAYLSGRTIPIRILVSANLTGGTLTGDTDVVLITDRSGSMYWRLNQDGISGNTINDCNNQSIYDNSTNRISLAKCLAKDFVNSVLGSNQSKCPAGTVIGNRVGLVSFGSSASQSASVSLTDNITQLTNAINGYAANLGATCVSCAINRAWEMLENQSNSSRIKYVIVMTDGETNRRSTPTCSDTYGIDAKTGSAFVAGNLGYRLARLINGSWEEVKSPSQSIMRGVSVLNDTFGFSVGNGGTILKWNGTDWNVFSSPTTNNLRKIKLLNASLGFAAGEGGRIIKWDGTAWNTETSPTTQQINGVDILNATLAFAVANGAKILQWNGTSWSETNDFGDFSLNDIAIVNTTLAFAVGDSGRIYSRNSTSWSLQQDMGSINVYGVDAIQGRAFAVGGSGKIYTWTGSTWSENADTGSETHNDVSIVNSSSAYVVTSNGDSGNAILYSWNGNSWTLFKPINRYAYSGNSTAGASCSDSDTDSLPLNQSYPALNVNYSAYRIFDRFKDNVSVTIDSIGFGPISAPSRVLARETLQAIASTGNGTYYASSDGRTLQTIYCQIAENINTRLTLTQILLFSGSLNPATLYTDSFIEYEYNSSIPSANYQEIAVSMETDAFPSCNGSFFVPYPLRVVDSKATSYSSDLWTSLLTLRNSQNYTVFNLSEYRTNFTEMGDPFIVRIPESQIQINSTNFINISLGNDVNVINNSCSSSNRVVYKGQFRASVPYGSIFLKSTGGIYRIYFDKNFDGTSDGSFNITIGEDLLGFNSTIKDADNLDPDNALEDALKRLLDALNFVVFPFNSGQAGSQSNPIDIELKTISIDARSISGIPFTWGPAEVRIDVGI